MYFQKDLVPNGGVHNANNSIQLGTSMDKTFTGTRTGVYLYYKYCMGSELIYLDGIEYL